MNYALFDGRKITLRGSALRSRGIEPYLKRLSDQLIRFLLGASDESPLPAVEDYRRRLAARAVPVAELAKSETLSQNPDAYERFVAEGGKPLRAALEALLEAGYGTTQKEVVGKALTAAAAKLKKKA